MRQIDPSDPDLDILGSNAGMFASQYIAVGNV